MYKSGPGKGPVPLIIGEKPGRRQGRGADTRFGGGSLGKERRKTETERKFFFEFNKLLRTTANHGSFYTLIRIS